MILIPCCLLSCDIDTIFPADAVGKTHPVLDPCLAIFAVDVCYDIPGVLAFFLVDACCVTSGVGCGDVVGDCCVPT